MRKIAAGLALVSICVSQQVYAQNAIFLKCVLKPEKTRVAGGSDRSAAQHLLNQTKFTEKSEPSEQSVYISINIESPKLGIFNGNSYFCDLTNEDKCIDPSFENKKDEHNVNISTTYSSILISEKRDIGSSDPNIEKNSYSTYKNYKLNRDNGNLHYQIRRELPQNAIRCSTELNQNFFGKCMSGKFQKYFHPNWEIEETVQEGKCEESIDMSAGFVNN